MCKIFYSKTSNARVFQAQILYILFFHTKKTSKMPNNPNKKRARNVCDSLGMPTTNLLTRAVCTQQSGSGNISGWGSSFGR
jgi:hypothetical protein